MDSKIRPRNTVVARLIRSLVAGLALTVLLGAPAAAAPLSETRYFDRGHHATASRERCIATPDSDITTCRHLSIQVFSGRRGGTDPATRFRGYEVRVSKGWRKENHVTGRILASRFENGYVSNSPSLRVEFDRIQGAVVEGTIRVQVQACDRHGECVDTHRDMDLDLEWTARPGPAWENFTYSRTNDGNCETTHISEHRGRRARMAGLMDAQAVRVGGWLATADISITRVCT